MSTHSLYLAYSIILLMLRSGSAVDNDTISCNGTFSPVPEFVANWSVEGVVISFDIRLTQSTTETPWAAIGFNDVGPNMVGADVVIGWIDFDMITAIRDRYELVSA